MQSKEGYGHAHTRPPALTVSPALVRVHPRLRHSTGSAHYSRMPNQITTINFLDTFISKEHLIASFPSYTVELQGPASSWHPPFKVRGAMPRV